MGRSNQSFNRRERERNKKMKADAKRERRQARSDPSEDGEAEAEAEVEPTPAVDEGDIIRRLEELTARFDAGDVEFEDYEQQRSELLAQLLVD